VVDRAVAGRVEKSMVGKTMTTTVVVGLEMVDFVVVVLEKNVDGGVTVGSDAGTAFEVGGGSKR
jgi:hypothetical protein